MLRSEYNNTTFPGMVEQGGGDSGRTGATSSERQPGERRVPASRQRAVGWVGEGLLSLRKLSYILTALTTTMPILRFECSVVLLCNLQPYSLFAII
jgi:hypothetical protein